MTFRRFRCIAVPLALVGCSQGSSPEFAAVVQPVAGESVEQPTAQTVAIYQEVLRFYRPAGGKMRLLDRTLLSADSSEVVARIAPSIAATMVSQLGDSFCVSDEGSSCNGRSRGGLLQVSPVYRMADARVRVVVRYSSIEPNAPSFSSTQIFLLEQVSGQWEVRGRR